MNFQDKANFIWSVADLLRGDYKQADYGKVILPLTVLRRLDCVLAANKEAVLARAKSLDGQSEHARDLHLGKVAGQSFYNTSRYDFAKLRDDPGAIASNLNNYIKGFSRNAREILEYFRFADQITKLEEANLLYLVVKRFNDIDLHPDVVSNIEMGYIYE